MAESALRDIIRYYTREAGVRSLEREVSKICRKVVKMLLLKKSDKKVIVNSKNLDKFLGVRRYDFGVAERKPGGPGGRSGMDGSGRRLADHRSRVDAGQGRRDPHGDPGRRHERNSIEAARTVVRSRAQRTGIKADVFEKSDIHIHVPEGATPKDGPSAGIAMVTSIVSC